jgi:hypothetical protein
LLYKVFRENKELIF